MIGNRREFTTATMSAPVEICGGKAVDFDGKYINLQTVKPELRYFHHK